MIKVPDYAGTCTCNFDTPLGSLVAIAENNALTGLRFSAQKHNLAKKDNRICDPDYPVFKKLRDWLGDYFSGTDRPHNLQLAPRGTVFQEAVWNILLKIPFGQVSTYGDVARGMAAACGLPSMSAQAVGGAIGRNPITILIPCHRVVGADRRLVGYAGGLDKKEALLQVEHINLARVKLYQLD